MKAAYARGERMPLANKSEILPADRVRKGDSGEGSAQKVVIWSALFIPAMDFVRDVYCPVVPRLWQAFHSVEVGTMSVALAVITAGRVITVVRRLQGTASTLK
jgi:hypothetical protein